MKLISLNVWGGSAGKEALLEFFRYHQDVDVFCLQEVWDGGEEFIGSKEGIVLPTGVSTTLLKDIDAVLAEHAFHFEPLITNCYGIAIFLKNSFRVVNKGGKFVYREKGYVSVEDMRDHARPIQYVTIETPEGTRTIVHFHGLWNGKGKGDSEERLLQSDNIVAFLETLDHPFVFCGDFNLSPETESLKKFETMGLRNLISEYGITSTRSSHYKKEIRYADYAFVSDAIEVKNFQVLSDEVSDHLPLYLEFD